MDQVGTRYGDFDESRNFDAVVIGSGIGGLGVAALLALDAGKRVLVLERHTVAGGFTHTFSRKGWEWDTGLHYVGGVTEEGTLLRRLFDRVSEKRLQWRSTGDVVDRIVVGDRDFRYLAGREAWREAMVEAFPGEETAIDRFLDLTREVNRAAPGFFSSKVVPSAVEVLFGWALRRRFLRHSDRTLAEVLGSLTNDEMLRAVLAAQLGDHGMPPSKASFAIHAMVFGHYLEGAAYPVGGSAAIARSIAPAIEERGGAIVVGAEVERILLEGKRAAGVRLTDGREIRCPTIISDVGVPNTIDRLLPDGAPGRSILLGAVEGAGISAAHCCLHVGLDATAEELDLPRANLWIYPGPDHDENLRRFAADPSAPLPLVFISFPSAKDPEFLENHPGKATIEVTTFAPFEHFARWADGRDDEYRETKARLARRLRDVLIRHVPQVTDHLAFTDLSTPLTTRRFCNYERGEIYGLDHGPARFRQRALRPKTPIRGLWLTGQDVCTAGIAGALLGGVLCASAILGKNLLKE